METNEDDEARPTEYLQHHWYGSVITDDKGNPIARSGTGAPFELDDAKPVNEEVDPIEKLKADAKAMKARINKKGGKKKRITRGKLRARSRRKKGGQVKPIDLAKAKKELRDEFNFFRRYGN